MRVEGARGPKRPWTGLSDVGVRFARFGLRARMLVVALSVGLPFLAFLVFTTVQQAALDREHVGAQTRLLAALAAARLDDNVGDVRQLLNALADTLGTDEAATFRNDLLLRNLQPRFPPDVSSLSIWALDGSNIGSTEPMAQRARPNVAAQLFFREALGSETMVSEVPTRLPADGEWGAYLAMPMVRDGKVAAVVCAAGHLADLQSLLDPNHDLPEGAGHHDGRPRAAESFRVRSMRIAGSASRHFRIAPNGPATSSSAKELSRASASTGCAGSSDSIDRGRCPGSSSSAFPKSRRSHRPTHACDAV